MDISSLLSPTESPADSPVRETPPPTQHALASPSLQTLQSPSKRAIRQVPSRTHSGLSQQVTSSPQLHLAFQQLQSPGITSHANGVRAAHSAAASPLASPREARLTPPHPLQRNISATSMDTLADLATMQQPHQSPLHKVMTQRPPFSLKNIPRTISASAASDITMAETPPTPRSFVSKALEQQHVDYLAQLDQSLSANPLDYYGHVNLVTVLHQGFQYHRSDVNPGNPHAFELITILRDAYGAMARRFPLGQSLWEYRLEDEKALASNVEERMTLLELYKQASQEEPYSVKLWHAYGDYVDQLVSLSWEQGPAGQWPEDERAVGRELFTPQLLVGIWERGANMVKYNIQDSSMVWDRYLQFLRDDLERSGRNPEKVPKVMSVFQERLGQPHATWADTLSSFASFVSSVKGDPEAAMEAAVQQYSHIKQQYSNREEFEFKLLQAMQQGDQPAVYHAMTRYLKWEKKTMGVYSAHLVDALYERATLQFPVDPSLWEDHIEFLVWQNDSSSDLLSVVERATQHCPWSGALWSHRILTLEAEDKGFDEMERVKHTATKTGHLEHADLEELIKVQIAWCGYLRRRAFSPRATEDDLDIAEVGIRSALELVREVGMKKHGREWPGDASYRLERIHIKFWTQRGNVAEARNIWNYLVKGQENSYDFWYRYYIFEMVVWANQAVRDKSNEGKHLLTPTAATAVLEKGMEHLQTIDQPEPLIEMYVNHCEQHESVLKVRSAQIERRRSERLVAIRRQREATETIPVEKEPPTDNASDVSGKRKRADTENGNAVTKKTRQAEEDMGAQASESPLANHPRQASEAPSNAASATNKRDREHTTIIVQHLPQNTTQLQLRKFFTDSGTVRNISIKPGKEHTTAFVEFELPEEAEYALTKQAKGFEGHEIVIKRGKSTTLYVANYPAHADEAYLRELFSSYGEICGVRFPSLKYDTHRRFCYIQFIDSDEAVAATQLDGTDVEGFKIIAKISNPNAKKERDGATAEGREVYVWRLNFKAKRREIEEVFGQFGKIERIKLPVIPNGNNKGFAYIVYGSKEHADSAVAEMEGKEFWGLTLKVSIASDKEAKPKIKSTIENSVAPDVRQVTPGEPELLSTTDGSSKGTKSDRSIAMLNLPDTVNDARIRTLVDSYGYKKITLMPQHGGAIVEFTAMESAGKAEIALQGQEFEGRKLRIGRVKELLEQKGEWKASTNFVQPSQVKRPATRGGRGRGKPGLGYRPAVPRNTDQASNGKAKSNDDFRTMLLERKGDQKEHDAVPEQMQQ